MADRKGKNVFEIIDGMMVDMHRTKRMFLIMIVSTMILPPLSMLIMVQLFDPPFEGKDLGKEQIRKELGLPEDSLTDEQKKLLKEEIDSKKPLLKPPQLIITIISIIWLGIGIRQWFVLNRWSVRYQNYKKKMDEIDQQLDDDGNDGDNDDDSTDEKSE